MARRRIAMTSIKILKKALALRKDRLSDEICIKIILSLSKDEDVAASTICAYFREQHYETQKLLDKIEADFRAHLAICSQEARGHSL
jgi:hypothetical protein